MNHVLLLFFAALVLSPVIVLTVLTWRNASPEVFQKKHADIVVNFIASQLLFHQGFRQIDEKFYLNDCGGRDLWYRNITQTKLISIVLRANATVPRMTLNGCQVEWMVIYRTSRKRFMIETYDLLLRFPEPEDVVTFELLA